MEIQQIPNAEVPDDLALAAIALEYATWPTKKPDLRSEAEKVWTYRNRSVGRQAFFAFDQKLLGYAEIFPRVIHTGKGSIKIMGLGSVCVDLEARGSGLGRKLVEACFDVVDKSNADVCLFQTGVPDFYKKFNGKCVNNVFVNRTDPDDPDKNPFWDDYVMIYPSSYNWPSGIIDLNGKGY